MTTTLTKVDCGFHNIRFYEEYQSAAEKKKAQRGAKRGKPTGKSRGFILVDHRKEAFWIEGEPTCYRSMLRSEVNGKAPEVEHTYASNIPHVYLWKRCRYVGSAYVPKDWHDVLLSAGWFKIVNGVLYEVEEE